jgi:hypothetical protein
MSLKTRRVSFHSKNERWKLHARRCKTENNVFIFRSKWFLIFTFFFIISFISVFFKHSIHRVQFCHGDVFIREIIWWFKSQNSNFMYRGLISMETFFRTILARCQTRDMGIFETLWKSGHCLSWLKRDIEQFRLLLDLCVLLHIELPSKIVQRRCENLRNCSTTWNCKIDRLQSCQSNQELRTCQGDSKKWKTRYRQHPQDS